MKASSAIFLIGVVFPSGILAATADSTTLDSLKKLHREGIAGWCPGTDTGADLIADYKRFLLSEGLGFAEFAGSGPACVMVTCFSSPAPRQPSEEQFHAHFDLVVADGRHCFREKTPK